MKLATRVMRFLLDGGRKLGSDPRRSEVDGDEGFCCVANTGKTKIVRKKTYYVIEQIRQ
ncbi:hypothetical protein [Rossellomorea sp. NRS-1567]|uniref:hypothetical protein n=1 Tax=Rossellomorea sp. NRS-1567 TaxID=3233901 RepID=UPI003D296D51